MTAFRNTPIERRYFAFLHRLECVITGRVIDLQAAHIRFPCAAAQKPITGIATKPDPWWTLPLSANLHREQHERGDERAWWLSHGFDTDSPSLSPLTLCLAIWRCFEAGEDVDAARAEIAQHRMNIAMNRQEREHFAEPPQVEKPVKRRRGPGPQSRPFPKTHRPLRGKRTKETT